MMTLFRIAVTAYILLLCCSLPALAQTAVTEQQADNYYYNCLAKPDPRMTPKTQDAMCACTSVMMMQHMSIEDIQVMAGNTNDSRKALNKMLLNVYAPCMAYPVQDLVKSECLRNDNMGKTGAKMQQGDLCTCIADRTSAWFVGEGRALMEDVLRKNPNVTDPIGPVMEAPSFKSQTYNSMIACLTGGGSE